MIYFHFSTKTFLVCETSFKQINNQRTLVNLYKYIVLVTRVHIFRTALFTNNIKVMIQIDAFLAHLTTYYVRTFLFGIFRHSGYSGNSILPETQFLSLIIIYQTNYNIDFLSQSCYIPKPTLVGISKRTLDNSGYSGNSILPETQFLSLIIKTKINI